MSGLTDDDMRAAIEAVPGHLNSTEFVRRIRNIVGLQIEERAVSMDELNRRAVRLRTIASQLAHWRCRIALLEPLAELQLTSDLPDWLLAEARYHEQLWMILLDIAERQ